MGDAAPQFTAFAGKKAISNRRAFRDKLRPLAEDPIDAVVAAPGRLAELAALVSSFHAPCLRLELLQFVLHLDSSVWSVDRLAQSRAERMGTPRRASNHTS